MIEMTWWFYWFTIVVVATGTAFVAYWAGVGTAEKNAARKDAEPTNVWNNVRVVPDKSPASQEQP